MKVITQLQRQKGMSWSVERIGHAACCLGFGSSHPQLLVTGGIDNDGNTLKDAWIFDISKSKWKEVSEWGEPPPKVYYYTLYLPYVVNPWRKG